MLGPDVEAQGSALNAVRRSRSFDGSPLEIAMRQHAMEAAEEESDDGLTPCPHCARRFQHDTAQRHIAICEKVGFKNRKEARASSQGPASAEKKDRFIGLGGEEGKMPKWKVKSKIKSGLDTGEEAEDDGKPSCPSCGRKFAHKDQADRHIAVCEKLGFKKRGNVVEDPKKEKFVGLGKDKVVSTFDVSAQADAPAVLGVFPRQLPPKKCVVKEVAPGSWAEKVGIRVGDEILAVNGIKIARLNPAGFRVEMGQRPLAMSLKRTDTGSTTASTAATASPGAASTASGAPTPPLPSETARRVDEDAHGEGSSRRRITPRRSHDGNCPRCSELQDELLAALRRIRELEAEVARASTAKSVGTVGGYSSGRPPLHRDRRQSVDVMEDEHTDDESGIF